MMYAYIYEFEQKTDSTLLFRKAYLTEEAEELPKVGNKIRLESQDVEKDIQCCRGYVSKVEIDFVDADDNVVIELKSTIKRHTIKLINFEYVPC